MLNFQVAIRIELNQFKLNEMQVHKDSRINTLFYDVRQLSQISNFFKYF